MDNGVLMVSLHSTMYHFMKLIRLNTFIFLVILQSSPLTPGPKKKEKKLMQVKTELIITMAIITSH